jgi:hypothetical protein
MPVRVAMLDDHPEIAPVPGPSGAALDVLLRRMPVRVLGG